MLFPDKPKKETEVVIPVRLNKLTKDQRLETISALYLKGFNILQIADKLGVSNGLVGKAMQEIHQRWVQNQITNIGIYKARELERLALLEAEYWAAWEKSKNGQNKIISSKLKRQTMRGDSTETTDAREFLDIPGDPRYLEGVVKCATLRSKILGLEEATKIEYSGSINHSYSIETRGKMTEDERLEGAMRFIESLEESTIEEKYEPTFAITESVKAGNLQETPD